MGDLFGFFYIFSIDFCRLHYEDVEAIKKSNGRLKIDYTFYERECVLKFGVSKNLGTLYSRMVRHKKNFDELSKPEIKLCAAVYIPHPYAIEDKLKQKTGGEWIEPKTLEDLLIT